MSAGCQVHHEYVSKNFIVTSSTKFKKIKNTPIILGILLGILVTNNTITSIMQ
jgi:hypothetical protein